MHIFVAGGTGFIGRHLVRRLLEKGYRVTATGTRLRHASEQREGFAYVRADLTQKGEWQDALHDVDAVVNLVGKTLFHRWTKAYKKEIRESRTLSTKHIVDALEPSRTSVLINASAVGFYGSRGDAILDETASSGDDFLAHVGKDWESEALKGEAKGVRVICARFGIVLGENGGAVEKMVAPFRFFVGGPLSDGMQWFPWIHLEDLVQALIWAFEKRRLAGPVNFCAPNPVQNRELSRIIGRILGRPAFILTPAWALRMVMGELGSALLSSQRCVPSKLTASGFSFRFWDIESAMRDILQP